LFSIALVPVKIDQVPVLHAALVGRQSPTVAALRQRCNHYIRISACDPATDPYIIFTAAAVLLAAGLLAAYTPARQASRIDPMSSLRCE